MRSLPPWKRVPIGSRLLKSALRGAQVREIRRWLVTGSPSPAAWDLRENEWWYPDVIVSIDGQPIYQLDVGCNCSPECCEWHFAREAGSGSIPEDEALAAMLRDGVTELDDETLALAARIVPDGSYAVVLLDLAVGFVSPGDTEDFFVTERIWDYDARSDPSRDERSPFVPFDPATPYYRTASVAGPSPSQDHLILPLYTGSLDQEAVESYARAMHLGGRPTAVSLTMLGHCEHPFGHILLDGHHKVHAATLTGRPIRLMAFVMPFRPHFNDGGPAR